jgi:hypothetical protein
MRILPAKHTTECEGSHILDEVFSQSLRGGRATCNGHCDIGRQSDQMEEFHRVGDDSIT